MPQVKPTQTGSESVGKAVDAVEGTGSEAATTAKDLVQSAAGGLADMAAGVVRQIVPASSAGDGVETDRDDGEKGKHKRDKDGDPLSSH